jgi:hypothetical protein
VQESGKQSSVCRGEAWFADLPLQDGELVAQHDEVFGTRKRTRGLRDQ